MVIKENSNHDSNAFGRIYLKGKSDYGIVVSNDLKNAVDENILYIHDKEHFSNTINCISISLKILIKNGAYSKGTHFTKINSLIDVMTIAIIAVINIETEISGGLTFVNFDQEIAEIIEEYELKDDKKLIKSAVKMFFSIINSSNARVDGSPYISVSIGVVDSVLAGEICDTILEVLRDGTDDNMPYIFPNVQFRVTNKHHMSGSTDENNFLNALKTTAIQMNPTYLICNSEANKNINPKDIHVVGCRSRLYKTKNGTNPIGAGRANIGVISINLPLLALTSKDLEVLKNRLRIYMDISVKGLRDKRNYIKHNKQLHSQTILNNNLLVPHNKSYEDMLDNASISIGFIGGYEAAEIMNKMDTDVSKIFKTLENIILFMNEYCEKKSTELDDIITLIGVSGEGLSYKFLEIDRKHWNMKNDRGFYTNSFHVPVDFKLRVSEKLRFESPFHRLCTGGGISYIEISHVEENIKGLKDVIEIAKRNNIHYLGFNFDKNVCKNCNSPTFNFEKCETCGSNDIIKIRRVSGYLGYLDSFSYGKKLEENIRIKHCGTNKG